MHAVLPIRLIRLAVLLAAAATLRAQTEGSPAPDFTVKTLAGGNGALRQRYALLGIPTSIFIDTSGVVRLVHRGPISPDALQHGLSLILPSS